MKRVTFVLFNIYELLSIAQLVSLIGFHNMCRRNSDLPMRLMIYCINIPFHQCFNYKPCKLDCSSIADHISVITDRNVHSYTTVY